MVGEWRSWRRRRISETASSRGRLVPLIEWVLESATLLVVASPRHHVVAAVREEAPSRRHLAWSSWGSIIASTRAYDRERSSEMCPGL